MNTDNTTIATALLRLLDFASNEVPVSPKVADKYRGDFAESRTALRAMLDSEPEPEPEPPEGYRLLQVGECVAEGDVYRLQVGECVAEGDVYRPGRSSWHPASAIGCEVEIAGRYARKMFRYLEPFEEIRSADEYSLDGKTWYPTAYNGYVQAVYRRRIP